MKRPPFPIEPPLPNCRCVLPGTATPDLDCMTGRIAEWLIDQRRREMFHEIMGTRLRRVTAHMVGMDISFGPGTVRQTPKPPPMRRPSEEPE